MHPTKLLDLRTSATVLVSSTARVLRVHENELTDVCMEFPVATVSLRDASCLQGFMRHQLEEWVQLPQDSHKPRSPKYAIDGRHRDGADFGSGPL